MNNIDTIEVSNLNRQFLFRKQHVGKSKAVVARETVLKFAPHVTIYAHHGNVKDEKFSVTFFKKFDLILNGLDNLDARNYVNRMSLTCGVPEIESGTQGYLGQVKMIKHGITECFECKPHTQKKSFAVCTIRSTPDKPIHCIVWATHLFALFFGPSDDDNLLSDMKNSIDFEDPSQAFHNIFHSDIQKLIASHDWSKKKQVRGNNFFICNNNTCKCIQFCYINRYSTYFRYSNHIRE